MILNIYFFKFSAFKNKTQFITNPLINNPPILRHSENFPKTPLKLPTASSAEPPLTPQQFENPTAHFLSHKVDDTRHRPGLVWHMCHRPTDRINNDRMSRSARFLVRWPHSRHRQITTAACPPTYHPLVVRVCVCNYVAVCLSGARYVVSASLCAEVSDVEG